jgi:hypothetical protein
MARVVRYVWPTLAIAWLVAFAAADASSVGVPSVLPAVLLLAAVAWAFGSVVDTSGPVLAAAGIGMARHTRTVSVLRTCDPDAAGRPRPRAPSA